MPSETTRPQAQTRTIIVTGQRLILHAKLYIFHDGHLGLGTSARELAPVVDQYLTAPASSSTASA